MKKIANSFAAICREKPFVIYLFLTVVMLFPYLFFGGVPFKYDWTWPWFDFRIMMGTLLNTLTGLPDTMNRTPFFLFYLTGYLVRNPDIFFRIFLISVFTFSQYGMNIFLRDLTKNKMLSFLGGFFYGFSPFIFIRLVVGFSGTLIAYTFAPYFLFCYFQKAKNWKFYLITGSLLAMIFAQIQVGFLMAGFIFLHSLFLLIQKNPEVKLNIKKLFIVALVCVTYFVFWFIILKISGGHTELHQGKEFTTLNTIASMPRSYKNIITLSDHHITFYYFSKLIDKRLFLLPFIILWGFAGLAVFDKSKRNIVIPSIVLLILTSPFLKGPSGLFGGFYTWAYNHIPYMSLFRETYHFQFIWTLILIITSIVGIDYGIKKWDRCRVMFILIVPFIAFGFTYPFITYAYNDFLKPIKVQADYQQLYKDLSQKKICSFAYYPPGLGFDKLKIDPTPNASNSDNIAFSLGIPYLDDGSSVLNLPTEDRYFRNELVSQFYETKDDGTFVSLLLEKKIDCVIVRNDVISLYNDASSLHLENDKIVRQKWLNQNYIKLLNSKKGLQLVKRYGNDIYIYKPNKSIRRHKIIYNRIEPLPIGDKILLPITDWAYNFAYYEDGWSRGRYDFWRKMLFSQLRQDFIYTDKKGSKVVGKVAQRGSYELWARYLTGGTAGNVEIKMSNDKFTIIKDPGEERFMVKKLGDVNITDGKVIIENVQGENAIADLFLVEE